jgi:hypothetical protein
MKRRDGTRGDSENSILDMESMRENFEKSII